MSEFVGKAELKVERRIEKWKVNLLCVRESENETRSEGRKEISVY